MTYRPFLKHFDAPLIARSIREAFPEREVALRDHSIGWDNWVVEVDGEWIARFPKNAEGLRNLATECRVLEQLQSRIHLAVPRMRLIEGPYPFTWHRKIPGAHLTFERYRDLPEAGKASLARTLAQFFAELHATPLEQARSWIGAKPLCLLEIEEIRRYAAPVLPDSLKPYFESSMAGYEALAPAEKVFGYFDAHGENMAFDEEAGLLRGIYDFMDVAIADYHWELHCLNWIGEDLTLRACTDYERLTGRKVDRERVRLYTAICRFSNLGICARDRKEEGITSAIALIEAWRASGGAESQADATAG